MGEEFKPCPFCGGREIRCTEHREHSSPTGRIYSMCCYNCGATFPNRYKKELLTEAWNTRHADTQLAAARAENERLRAFVERCRNLEWFGGPISAAANIQAQANYILQCLATTQAAGDGEGVMWINRNDFEAAQQELMKIYALALARVAIPQSFWADSIERMVKAHIINISITEEKESKP